MDLFIMLSKMNTWRIILAVVAAIILVVALILKKRAQ